MHGYDSSRQECVVIRRLIGGLALGVFAASCTTSPVPGAQAAQATCEQQAGVYGPDFAVAGVFATTVGEIRSDWLTTLWPDLGDNHPATLCYLDGPIAKAPPPAESGETNPSFDRAIVGVADDAHTDLLAAGSREILPIVQP